MSIKYFKTLLLRSAKLQQEIEKEQQRRSSNWLRLLKLKKLRLMLKDRMRHLIRAGAKDKPPRMPRIAVRRQKPAAKPA